MKKYSLFLAVVLLLSFGFSVGQAGAQEKTKAELDKEQQMQKAIELQKKAMAEQNKAVEEAKKAIDEKVKQGVITEIEGVKQQQELERAMKAVVVTGYSTGSGASAGTLRFESGQDNGRPSRSRSNFSYSGDAFGTEPFIVSPGVEWFSHGMGGDTERTTWDFSKSVKESTFTKNYAFDVEKTVKTVVMSVMGDCKAGEIRVKILMPNGKNYSDIVIDEFGNLNWRKSFTVSETENQDKTGEWKFQITSTKATGYFKISLQTY